MRIESVPVKTIVRKSKISPFYWIAKSAVQFKNWLGQSVLVHGFSCNSDEAKAIHLSRMEIFERLFAHYDFVKKDILQWVDWPQKDFTGDILPEEVLLGPMPSGPMNSKLDASGLSWHKNVEEAEKHALLEIIERHLLCKWWYGDLKLKKMEETIELSDDLFIEFATVDLLKPIPFVIAVISHRLNYTWLCGSSVRTSFQLAKEKAKNEALMLLDGILCGDETNLNPNKETSAILLSLRDPDASQKRRYYYEVNLSGQEYKGEPLPTVEMSVDEICKWTLGEEAEIKSVVIRDNEEGSLVRVLCSSALKVKEMRKIAKYDKLLDPFC